MDKHIKPVLYNKFYISTVFTNLKLQSYILFLYFIYYYTCKYMLHGSNFKRYGTFKYIKQHW